MIYVDTERCTGCGVCVPVCPTGALSLQKGRAFIVESLCRDCEACREVCPQSAIMSVETIEPPLNRQIEPAGYRIVQTTPAAAAISSPRILPLIGSALLWAGREIVPRLVSLALTRWERRSRPAERFSPDVITGRMMQGQGRRCRQRQHRGR